MTWSWSVVASLPGLKRRKRKGQVSAASAWTLLLGQVWMSPTLVSWIALFHIILLSGVHCSIYSCHCNLTDNHGPHAECKIFIYTIWFFWQPASLVPRHSPQKQGGESLVISTRNAVDFRHVIFLVINVGHSHFSNKFYVIRHAISVEAIYNFILCPRSICNSVEFCGILFTCKLGAAKYGEQAGPGNQLQWTLILDCLDLHSKTVLSPTFEVWSVIISWFSDRHFLAEWTKSCGFVLQFEWYCQSQVPEVNNFSSRCYQTVSSPSFWGECLGTRLIAS